MFAINVVVPFGRLAGLARRRLGLVTVLIALWLVQIASALTAAAADSGSAPSLARYTAGEVATEDIVASTPLVVFDPVRTQALRTVEAQKIPPIFRWIADSSQQADRALRDNFETCRADFVKRLSVQFGHPVPLLSVEVAQPAMAEVNATFRKAHQGFPLTKQLLELWAFGNSGDAVLDVWRDRLRQVTTTFTHIRADVLGEGERLTTPAVRVVEVETPERKVTLEAVERQGRNIAQTNLVPISRIQQEARRIAAAQTGRGPEDADVTTFILSFLSPNYLFDLELTQQARARRTAEIHVADRYAAGETLVKAGEIITPKVLLALEELKIRSTAEQAAVAAAVERSQQKQAETALSLAHATVAAATRTNQWLWGGLAVAGFLCLWLGWRWWRGHRALTQAVLAPDPTAYAMTTSSDDDVAWRARALEAEARAAKATALLRSSVLPHMAKWMMNELVQRLLSQRSAMVTSHDKAEKEVADLARRLDQLHAPLEERLHAYERRIAELEAELAAKGQQNAELIKAKIETTRKKLEVERGQEPLNWN